MRGSRNCRRGEGGGGGAAWKSRRTTASWEKWKKSSVDPEGGDRGVLPPWKITSYTGSIGDKQLDPSLEKVGPPSPGISWTPSGTLKIDFSLKLTI